MNMLDNLLKPLNLKATHVIAFVGFALFMYVAINYSSSKAGSMDHMGVGRPSASTHIDIDHKKELSSSESGIAQPAAPAGQNGGFAPVNGESSDTRGLPSSCAAGNVPDPSELLPRDQNNEWARLNPSGSQDFQNVNLLKAGYHTGIDTIGSSLRNANLQIRSEPPNPTNKVSPWMNTTIEPDLMRVPLEIGCGPQ